MSLDHALIILPLPQTSSSSTYPIIRLVHRLHRSTSRYPNPIGIAQAAALAGFGDIDAKTINFVVDYLDAES